jgi:putative two-component system response regulator
MYDICRYHHEQYDGSGYPEGLVGDLIPISAQLVSVAETLDALITDVVYRRAIPFDEAVRMILEGNCGVYSPKIMECLHIKKEDLREIYQRYEMEETK